MVSPDQVVNLLDLPLTICEGLQNVAIFERSEPGGRLFGEGGGAGGGERGGCKFWPRSGHRSMQVKQVDPINMLPVFKD